MNQDSSEQYRESVSILLAQIHALTAQLDRAHETIRILRNKPETKGQS